MRSKLRFGRANIAYGHDIFMASISLPLSLWLRMGDSINTVPTEFIVQSTVLFAVILTCVFWPMGLYRGIWRYASMNDLIQSPRPSASRSWSFVPDPVRHHPGPNSCRAPCR